MQEAVIIKKIAEKIRQSKTFLISAHVNLEGDALGSVLALYRLLRVLNKRVIVFNNDPVPDSYKFLPFYKVIRNELNPSLRFDVALVSDCSDSSRTGKVKDHLSQARCIINIDHHISNTFFGEINWVDPKAASACQMLYRLCKKMGVVDRHIALCLYTGMFTDTGAFTYGSTNSETHQIVSELMSYNIHPPLIYEKLHSICDQFDLQFIGQVMSSLKYDAQKKICWAVIKKWPEKSYDITEIIFTTLRLLKTVDTFILFKKIDANRVRVNFRSRKIVDVNHVAQFFGGGGHKRASGTTMEGSLTSVERKVIMFVKRYTNGFKKKAK